MLPGPSNRLGGGIISNQAYDISHVDDSSDSYTFLDRADLNEGQEGNVPKDAFPNPNPIRAGRGITRNIVVFGQTGAGKSSLINMLAGRPVAKVSNAAGGCTTSNQAFVLLEDVNNPSDSYTFWDTAGLNEGQEGNVPPKDAFPNLLELVNEHGVNLVIYCIRGRLVDIVRINYDLFWGAICRKGVPIVLVVTGLEAEQDMDEWWKTNQKTVAKMGMSFNGYACVTTTRGKHGAYKEEYEESAKKVWGLVRKHCGPQSWHMPPEWFAEAPKRMEEYMTRYKRGRKGWWKILPNSVRRLFWDRNPPGGT